MTRKLTIVINKEKKGYVATSVDLGVVSQGKTIEEAQKNLKEANTAQKNLNNNNEKNLQKTRNIS